MEMNMNQSFNNVPKDKGTRIIDQQELTIDTLTALKQRWIWDGVLADSLIFHSHDIEGLDDDALLSFINLHTDTMIIGSVTFKRNQSGYCFVNFNFVSFWLPIIIKTELK